MFFVIRCRFHFYCNNRRYSKGQRTIVKIFAIIYYFLNGKLLMGKNRITFCMSNTQDVVQEGHSYYLSFFIENKFSKTINLAIENIFAFLF